MIMQQNGLGRNTWIMRRVTFVVPLPDFYSGSVVSSAA